MKLTLYIAALLASLLVLNNFAGYWATSAPSQTHLDGWKLALLGGAGNTVPALIGIVAAVVGVANAALAGNAGIYSALRFVLRPIGLALSVFALFANAVLIYLKFQTLGDMDSPYVTMLGGPWLEVALIGALLCALFVRVRKPKLQN